MGLLIGYWPTAINQRAIVAVVGAISYSFLSKRRISSHQEDNGWIAFCLLDILITSFKVLSKTIGFSFQLYSNAMSFYVTEKSHANLLDPFISKTGVTVGNGLIFHFYSHFLYQNEYKLSQPYSAVG